MQHILSELARPRGDAYALVFKAQDVKSFDDYLKLGIPLIDEDLCRELLKERVIAQYARAAKPRLILGQRLPRRFWKKGNLIVNAGLTMLANAVTSGSATQLLYCGVGSSNTAPAANNTDLTSPITPRVAVTASYTASPNLAYWDTFFGPNANAGTWQEGGLFVQSAGGTMGSHALFASPITKNTSNTVVVEWLWTF